MKIVLLIVLFFFGVLGQDVTAFAINTLSERDTIASTTKEIRLSEVEVISSQQNENGQSLNSSELVKSFFFEKQESNFAKTLSAIPGVSSMDIGANMSKPVIRGFGFNRILVVDKGIVQQNQQWGADHGLEIDQYDVDNVVVYKGPMSLQLGSDGMGGAIEILPAKTPSEDIYMGDVTFSGKSNNDLLGLSVMNAFKKDKWFARVRYTNQRYSDYRVPADRFNYMTYDFPIYDKRLKNTAGKNENISGLLRYTTNKVEAGISVSNFYEKFGFFEGAHGIPNASRLGHDGSFRNISYPRSNVNHFKTIGNLKVDFSSFKLLADIGFQNNHRQEWSYFHTHYENQLPPEKDPDLEIDFDLKTYTANIKLLLNENGGLNHTVGANVEVQQNRIKGYNYFLPRFNQFSSGIYWISQYKPSESLTVNGGLRYDRANIDITGFYDHILADYLISQGYSSEEVAANAQRAYDLSKNFGNISVSLGGVYKQGDNVWRLNVGSSFRSPKANELASNGVHHGAFRHEQGNPSLKSEKGYQLDLGYSITKGILDVSVMPFASYFTNYIYLAPQGEWSILTHAGQLYRYDQAKAFFVGGEYSLGISITDNLKFTTVGEYVFNRNHTKKGPLPFTPPFLVNNELSYSGRHKFLKSYTLSATHRFIADQNRNAANEDKTSGTNLFGLSATSNILINKFRFTLGVQAQNLFDTKYFNHLSFYRKLNIPEPGRNIQLLIKIPFYKNI